MAFAAVQLGYAEETYDAPDRDPTFFGGDGQVVKLIAAGAPGYPAMPPLMDYISPSYDDSAWPDRTLPVLSDNYTTIPSGSTEVPAGTSGAGADGWSSRWVVRARVTFPDYALPVQQQYSTVPDAGRWDLTNGDRVYLCRLTTDNVGAVYLDGEKLIVNTWAVSTGGALDYTNVYLILCPPGEHLLVIDKLGDSSFDYIGIELAAPHALDVTFIPPSGTLGPITVEVHNAQLAVDRHGDYAQQEAFKLFSPRTGWHEVDLVPDASSRELSVSTLAVDSKGNSTWEVDDLIFLHQDSYLVPAPTDFPMLAQARAKGKLLPPLHIPKPTLVPAGVLVPMAPVYTPPFTPPPPPTPGLEWFVSPYDPASGFDGYFDGAYLKLYLVITSRDLPDASVATPVGAPYFWWGVGTATDNRTDGTGMLLEVDVFVGNPGNVAAQHYASEGDQPWDHYWETWRYSNWTNDDNSPHAAFNTTGDIPAGTEVWLLAQQWPYGHDTPLPLDPLTDWDPSADMGFWHDYNGDPCPAPWDLSSLVQIPLPVPSALWGP